MNWQLKINIWQKLKEVSYYGYFKKGFAGSKKRHQST